MCRIFEQDETHGVLQAFHNDVMGKPVSCCFEATSNFTRISRVIEIPLIFLICRILITSMCQIVFECFNWRAHILMKLKVNIFLKIQANSVKLHQRWNINSTKNALYKTNSELSERCNGFDEKRWSNWIYVWKFKWISIVAEISHCFLSCEICTSKIMIN